MRLILPFAAPCICFATVSAKNRSFCKPHAHLLVVGRAVPGRLEGVIRGREKFQANTHAGGLTNLEKERKKNFLMVRKGRAVKHKTRMGDKQARGGCTLPGGGRGVGERGTERRSRGRREDERKKRDRRDSRAERGMGGWMDGWMYEVYASSIASSIDLQEEERIGCSRAYFDDGVLQM